MQSIYKIETHSDSSANEVYSYIVENGGRCLIQGWAVITDFIFSSEPSQDLLSFISATNKNISESDINLLQENGYQLQF